MGINIIRPISVAVPKTADNLYDLSNDGIEARGDFGTSETLSTSGAGTRMVWYPRKGAIRAGTVEVDQWDDVNIGTYSAAFGFNNKASNMLSFIGGGEGSIASGGNSFVGGGGQNLSSNDNTVVVGGYGNTASGDASFVGGGYNNVASNLTSFVGGGSGNTSSGIYSVVPGGRDNIAEGDYSIAAGYNAQLSATADRTFAYIYNTVTTSITQPDAFIVYGSVGYEKKVGIQTLTPNATLDLNGTFTVASTATFNGDVVGIASDTSSIATSGTFATPYQPDTSNASFVTVSVRCTTTAASGSAYIEVKSDSSATPTTIIATAGIESGLLNEDNTFICSFFVKKGHYFQIDKTETNGTVSIKQWKVDALTIG